MATPPLRGAEVVVVVALALAVLASEPEVETIPWATSMTVISEVTPPSHWFTATLQDGEPVACTVGVPVDPDDRDVWIRCGFPAPPLQASDVPKEMRKAARRAGAALRDDAMGKVTDLKLVYGGTWRRVEVRDALLLAPPRPDGRCLATGTVLAWALEDAGLRRLPEAADAGKLCQNVAPSGDVLLLPDAPTAGEGVLPLARLWHDGDAAVEDALRAVILDGVARWDADAARIRLEPPPEAGWAADTAVRLTALGAGVWVHTTRIGLGGVTYTSNGLIVADEAREGAWFVDTAWLDPAINERLLDVVEGALGLTPRGVLVTHGHADRLGGAPVFAARGLPVWASEFTAEHAETHDRTPVAFDLLPASNKGELVPFAPFPRLTWMWPGAAHAPDNLVVAVDGGAVLFGGCAVRDAETTTIGPAMGVHVQGWLDALDLVEAAWPDPGVVVVGHGGPTGDITLLERTRELVRAAR